MTSCLFLKICQNPRVEFTFVPCVNNKSCWSTWQVFLHQTVCFNSTPRLERFITIILSNLQYQPFYIFLAVPKTLSFILRQMSEQVWIELRDTATGIKSAAVWTAKNFFFSKIAAFLFIWSFVLPLSNFGFSQDALEFTYRKNHIG